jgi:hypothetical protein
VFSNFGPTLVDFHFRPPSSIILFLEM